MIKCITTATFVDGSKHLHEVDCLTEEHLFSLSAQHMDPDDF